MKNTVKNSYFTKGFTLIELLVVVLITGILAAVALPQYQKAVEKSKAVQALVVLKALEQSAHSYYLANGKYPTKFAQLDIDMKDWTGTTKIHTGDNIWDTKSNPDWSLQLWSNDPGNEIQFMLLRTAGRYKAAGFYTYRGLLGCAEDVFAGFPASQKGMYCEKIFNAIDITTDGKFRKYHLP